MEDSINTGHDAMAKLIHFTGRSLSPSGWTRINMSFGQRLRFVKTKRISHGVRHAVVKLIFFQVVLVLVSLLLPIPVQRAKEMNALGLRSATPCHATRQEDLHGRSAFRFANANLCQQAAGHGPGTAGVSVKCVGKSQWIFHDFPVPHDQVP
jgi:hypothetical protein